jgi:hypothetical protein
MMPFARVWFQDSWQGSFKNELSAGLWFKEVGKASASIPQGKDLATGEGQVKSG